MYNPLAKYQVFHLTTSATDSIMVRRQKSWWDLPDANVSLAAREMWYKAKVRVSALGKVVLCSYKWLGRYWAGTPN